MKILVLGQGQMGRAVERVAAERDHTVLGPFGRANSATPGDWNACDLAVDFSVGAAVAEHVELALTHGVPLVVGTTGWGAELARVVARVEEAGGTLVWGANFSVGFHLLAHLTHVAAGWARAFNGFDVGVFEHHHRLKRDAPSGSALELAQILLDELPLKERLEAGRVDGPIDPNAVHVTSLRVGAEPGLHRVEFAGPSDSVSIEHRVRDRDVFAAGAIFAAERIGHRSGAIEFRDLVVDSMKEGGLWS